MKALSFAELADRHRSEILRYLIRLLGNEPDAQDTCQEVFMRAQQAFPRLAPDSNSRAWLYRIATNGALNAKRQRSRAAARAADVDPDTLPGARERADDRRDDLRAISDAVRALPQRQRAALMLRQVHEMSYAEIAVAVGGNEAAARANVYQAIKKLRAVLGGQS